MPQPDLSSPAIGLPQPMLASAQAPRREFLATLEPLRGELFRYCRRLTGSVWDAEDLAQEALARAFTRAAQTHQPVERPMA
ncbi:sigma factor [Streptomyces sp. NPDC005151]